MDANPRDTCVPQRVLRVVLVAHTSVFIKHLQRLGWNPGESSPAYSGPARGKAQQGNLSWHLFRVECDSGRHPSPGMFSIAGPAHSGKRVRGMPLLKASGAVRSNVRRARDLAQHSDLQNVQLAGCPPPSLASEEKDCRVVPETSPVHSVSPSSLRQGPKL